MVKFTHIRDPRDHRRVLTIARTIERKDNSEVAKVGFSVNFVTPTFTSTDTYNRKLGNKIALGRLEKSAIEVPLNGKHPMDAIRDTFINADREALATHQIPYRVQRIVELSYRDYLSTRQTDPA